MRRGRRPPLGRGLLSSRSSDMLSASFRGSVRYTLRISEGEFVTFYGGKATVLRGGGCGSTLLRSIVVPCRLRFRAAGQKFVIVRPDLQGNPRGAVIRLIGARRQLTADENLAPLGQIALRRVRLASPDADAEELRIILLLPVSVLLIAGMILFLCTTTYTTIHGGVGINQKTQFIIYTAAGLFGIAVLFSAASYLYRRDRGNRIIMAGIAVFAVFNIFFNVYIDQSKNDHMSSSQEVYASVVQSVQDLDPDVLPYRYHFWNAYYNRNLCKSLPATNAFMSVVDNGIFDFYETIQSPRHTGTPTRPPGISALLSVKYYVRGNTVRTGSNSESAVPSQKVYVRDVGEDCVPIGFAYDSYLLKSEYETIEDYSILGYVMMRTMVIRDEDESFVSQLLPHFDLKHAEEFDQEHLKEDIASRRRYSSSKFEANTTSFTSDIEVPEARFAFFSVPYSNRWSATVNGETVQILDANGLMAVPLSAGKNHIVFRYDIRINIISMVISLAFLIAEIILLMRNRLVHLHNPDKKHEAEAVM